MLKDVAGIHAAANAAMVEVLGPYCGMKFAERALRPARTEGRCRWQHGPLVAGNRDAVSSAVIDRGDHLFGRLWDRASVRTPGGT